MTVHWLWLLCVCLTSIGCSNSVFTLYKHTVESAIKRNATCNDQSPAIYYMAKSTSSRASTKWMIFLEGGGLCNSSAQCELRYTKMKYHLSSSVPLIYPESLKGRDVFEDSMENPFRDFHHVMIPYCTSDLFIGRNTAALQEGIRFNKANYSSYVFSGYYVIKEIFSDLFNDHGLEHATEVILAGSSAGVVGVLNHYDTVSMFAQNAKVSMLLDSGWIIDFQRIASTQLFTDEARRLSSLHHVPGCNKMAANGLPCCVSPDCLLRDLPDDVPVMMVVSSYDLFILQHALDKVIGEKKLTYETAEDLIGSYGGAVKQTLYSLQQKPYISIVQTQCSQHTYLVSTSLWEQPAMAKYANRDSALLGGEILFEHSIQRNIWRTFRVTVDGREGESLLELIKKWYDMTKEGSGHANQTRLRVADDCIGFICNPRCPDDVTIGRLSRSVKGHAARFIVVFAATIVVGALLIKICLKFHLRALERENAHFVKGKDRLLDCLPDCLGVSVACQNLSLQVTVASAVSSEKDEGITVVDGELNGPMRTLKDKRGEFARLHSDSPRPKPKRRINNPWESISSGPISRKVLIDMVTVYFNSGQMVAIMGPSGSGKTTLLDLLTGRREGNDNGEVLINGHPLPKVRKWYHRNTGYVRQLATPYYDELTVRQNLLYSGLLRSLGKEVLFERIEMVLNEVGLAGLEDTVVGGATGGGLSGGQKRRLCVAIQLISMPNILFLDEPTSGLDASMAFDLLKMLHTVAKAGRLVVLSIHQPRPEIYYLFDTILFLCKGKVAYFGEPKEAPVFFCSALEQEVTDGLISQETLDDVVNPADILLDLLTKETNQEKIIEAYSRSDEPGLVMSAVERAKKKAKRINKDHKTFVSPFELSLWSAFLSLEGRMKRHTWKKGLYLPLVFFFYGLGTGLAYRNATKGFLLLAAFNLLTGISFLFVSPVITQVLLGRCLHIFDLEHGDKVTHVFHLVLHTFYHFTAVTIVPFIVLTGLVFLMVCPSGIGDFNDFLLILLINLTSNGTSTALVILIVAAVPDYAVPIAHVVCAYVTFFEGFLYPVPDMQSYIKWAVYGNPNFYAFSSEMRILLENKQLPCKAQSKLHCHDLQGNAILRRFGFEEADPYEAIIIMLGMTFFFLLLAMLALQPKGYLKLVYHHWQETVDFHKHTQTAVGEEEDDDDHSGPHKFDVGNAMLISNESVYHSYRESGKNDQELILPYTRAPGPGSRRQKTEVRLRLDSAEIGKAIAESNLKTVETMQRGFLRQKSTRLILTERVAGTPMQTPTQDAAGKMFARWRERTFPSQEPAPAEQADRMLAASIKQWKAAVQERKLETRKAQSRRQLAQSQRNMEQTLNEVLNRVRAKSPYQDLQQFSQNPQRPFARSQSHQPLGMPQQRNDSRQFRTGSDSLSQHPSPWTPKSSFKESMQTDSSSSTQADDMSTTERPMFLGFGHGDKDLGLSVKLPTRRQASAPNVFQNMRTIDEGDDKADGTLLTLAELGEDSGDDNTTKVRFQPVPTVLSETAPRGGKASSRAEAAEKDRHSLPVDTTDVHVHEFEPRQSSKIRRESYSQAQSRALDKKLSVQETAC